MDLNDDLDVTAISDIVRSGMRSPRVVTLNRGQILYRFASTTNPPAVWAAGPWWMYDHDYFKIVDAHLQSRAEHKDDALTLGWLARAAMAVRQEWSQMDIVIKAVVNQEIKVFVGPGRSQYHEQMPNGILVTWKGWPNIEQIYIPNIGDRHGRTLLGYQALRVIKQKRVSSQQLF